MEERHDEIKPADEQEYTTDLFRMWKWSMFIAILGFIVTVVLFITGLFAIIFLCIFNKGEDSSLLTAWLGSSFIMITGIMFYFPVLKLFRFSKNIRDARSHNNSQLITKAFSNLRSSFTWLGILVIAGLVIYIITFIILGASVNFLKDIV